MFKIKHVEGSGEKHIQDERRFLGHDCMVPYSANVLIQIMHNYFFLL